MKVVHISDIHWRSLSRHNEYREVFTNLFKKLEEIKPDLIVNTGDTWHTKVQHITPEGITEMIWMYQNLSKYAPVLSTLGNHDGNLSNDQRDDIISFVHKIIDDERVKLTRNAEIITYQIKDVILRFHNFSCFDKEHWDDLHKQFDIVEKDQSDSSIVDIALFHGAISHSFLDNDFVLEHGELPKSNFLMKYPFAFLGDIHRRQFLDFRTTQDGNKKPSMGYAGSFIQQDFGEQPEGHGILVWDIRSKTDWDVEEIDISNPYSMHTIRWNDNPSEIIAEVRRIPNLSKNTVLRITHSEKLLQSDMKSVNHSLQQRFGLKEPVYAFVKPKEETVGMILNEKNLHKTKTPEELFKEFLSQNSNDKNLLLTSEEMVKANTLIRKIFNSIENGQPKNFRSNYWKIRWLYFDNLYAYGENNFIDFTSMKGTTGILGPNKMGKSSILGAIAYVLYNATDRGPIKGAYIINNHKKHCRAKICIEYDNELYFIERSTKRTSNTKTTTATKVSFYKETNEGKKISLTSISRDETDKEIRRMFGTIDDFRYTSLATQGDLMAFINEGNTERKKILARYLDITPYLAIGDTAKTEMKSYEQEAKKYSQEELANELSKLQEDLQFHINRKESYGTKEIQYNELINDLIEDLSKPLDKRAYEYASLTKRLETLLSQEEAYSIKSKELQGLIEQLKKELEEAQAQQESLHSELEVCKSNETAIANTKKLIQEKQEELKRLKKKLKLLDEIPCGDKFPNCSFIHDSFVAKESLPSNEVDLQILQKALLVQEKTYQGNASKVEQQLKLLNQKIVQKTNEHTSAITSFKNLQFTHSVVLKEKAEIEKSLKEIGSMSNVEELLNQSELKKAKLSEYRKLLAELKEAQSSDAFKILALEKDIEKHEQKTKNWEASIVEYRIRYVIANAFSKTGIPRTLLTDKIRDINAFTEIVTNHLDFNISTSTSLENNEVGIDLIDATGERPIETCSGAEKTFAALALRLAFIQCSMLPMANLIFLDESFGALDETAVVIAQNLLSVFEQHFDNVFVISHDPYLKSIVTHSLDIKKDGKFSQIGTECSINLEWTIED